MLWRQSCAFQFHCQYSLEIAWTHQQTVDFDWFTPRFFTVGGPQYQRLHSNNISKTGSKLGDGFQKHLLDLQRMNKMMTQSQSLTVSTFQIIPAKTRQSAGFFLTATKISDKNLSCKSTNLIPTEYCFFFYICFQDPTFSTFFKI